jgi:hypothetical protein
LDLNPACRYSDYRDYKFPALCNVDRFRVPGVEWTTSVC